MNAATDLIELVRGLGAPFGLERSVKISLGSLVADRYLLSVHRDALGASPASKLEQIARSLEMPESFIGGIGEALVGADVVHFGHEAGGETRIRKIYFEYAERARRAIARGDPALVHLAYKWTPGRSQGAAVTRYTSSPCRTRDDLESRFREFLPKSEAPRALHLSLGLLERVSPCADRGELLLMEVEEPGNPRRSLDLNVYNARLRLRDVADLVEEATKAFEIPDGIASAALGPAQSRALGHLSAGIGRDRAEFVTIYFGVEAH